MNYNELSQLKRWMNAALKLRGKGRRPEAIALLRPHLDVLKRRAPGAGLLATLYFENDDFKNAAEWYARAAALAPKSEMASLGLFHSLWKIGKHQKALKEMRRFLGGSDSREYSRLLHELQLELNISGLQTNDMTIGPAHLSLDERICLNQAERAGLDWRKSHRFAPLKELQNV